MLTNIPKERLLTGTLTPGEVEQVLKALHRLARSQLRMRHRRHFRTEDALDAWTPLGLSCHSGPMQRSGPIITRHPAV